MAPTRTQHAYDRIAPSFQTPTPSIITAFYLRQIEASHVRTPSRGCPIPLHFDSDTQSLSEWAWPCDPDSEERVPPSELEPFRRTHRFRAPSCLCALLDGTRYTESMIAIVETTTTDEERNKSILNGEYVASCARKRCGYFLCLERFYPLNHLKLQLCNHRKHPLQAQELASLCDIDKSLRAGDGLFQLMTDVVVRGPGNRLQKVNPQISNATKDALIKDLVDGMSEQRFWSTFVQCLLCKDVTLRKNFALGHVCGGKRARGHPYARPDSPTPYSAMLAGGSSSPAPTEIDEDDVFGGVEYPPVGQLQVNSVGVEAALVQEEVVASSDLSDEISSVITDDSFVLPTVAEIFATFRSTQPRSESDDA